MGTERVPINQAAKEIGCDPNVIRAMMYNGKWDLGEVRRLKNSCQKARYYIFRGKLDKFLGKENRHENVTQETNPQSPAPAT